MFFFPYGTDAPIYHWPITTVVLIVVNVFAFCTAVSAPEQAATFVLVFGDGLHPIQWLTCNFLHAGVAHLIGNMSFLWCFGLIVEGKLGWYKTLAAYLGIGVAHGAIVQILMLGSVGSALGASAAIFGFMAMCLIWAPENHMSFVFVVIYWFFVRIVDFQMKIVTLVGLFLAFQLGMMILTKMTMSSEVLHLTGAALGFGLALLMLKLRLVDCEHWDLFSVWTGRNKMSPEEREEADKLSASRQREEKRQRALRDSALEQIREMVGKGQLLMAVKAHQHIASKLPHWTLPESDLSGLIRALHAEKLWTESIPLMIEYLAQYPLQATTMRLKLAHILLFAQERPLDALKLMADIDESTLDDGQREFLVKLRAKAMQIREQSHYETVQRDG
jgi:membrane associated rhomboid family serine protease